MKETMHQIEEKIKTFLLNYFHNGYFIKDEAVLFLQNYAKYILLYNDIDPNLVKINLHSVKYLPNKIHALTTFTTNEEKFRKTKVFDVYFLLDMLSCPSYLEANEYNNLLSLKIKNKTLINELSSQLILARLIFKAGHEFQHVVQIVKETSDVIDINDYFEKTEKFIHLCNQLQNKDRSTRHLIKNYTNYAKSLRLISSIEINADFASKVYCDNLFGNIYETVEDLSEQEFLNILYWRCKHQYKIRKVNHAVGNSMYNKAKENLITMFGFDEQDVIIP